MSNLVIVDLDELITKLKYDEIDGNIFHNGIMYFSAQTLRAYLDTCQKVDGEAAAWKTNDQFSEELFFSKELAEKHCEEFCGTIEPLYTTPQPERVAELEARVADMYKDGNELHSIISSQALAIAELEAKLKVARDAITKITQAKNFDEPNDFEIAEQALKQLGDEDVFTL